MSLLRGKGSRHIPHYAQFDFLFAFFFPRSINPFKKGEWCPNSGKRKAADTWSLNIIVHSSCIVSGDLARCWDASSGVHCHIVYINQPSGHVKVTGSAKVLLGRLYCAETMSGPARAMQGDRCDLTWLQADCGHQWHCSWDQDGIS